MQVAQRASVYVVEWLTGVSVASLIFMVGSAWGAQPIEITTVTIPNSPSTSIGDGRAEVPLPRLWSSLTLSQGTTQLDYSEPDPLGRVSPLDSETGSIPTTQVAVRWRGQLATALPELLLQAHASYGQGQTVYSGYLQQGSTLTSYNSSTSNTFQTLRLRVGLPLSALMQAPWTQHIAPYAEHSWDRWNRNLTQYGETFDWQTRTLGVMGIWSLAELGLPQLAHFTLEVDMAVGRTRGLAMSAPALGFSANLGEANGKGSALALHYAITPKWLLGLRYTAQRSNFGASASVGGLQFPGASYNSQGWLVSVGAQL